MEEERKAIERFLECIEKELESRRETTNGANEDVKEFVEDWSENKYNFMKKYGHI